MTQQYILLVFFSPHPRSDAEDGNLEKPMGVGKKVSKKILSLITKAQGRTQPNNTENLQTITTLLQQNTSGKKPHSCKQKPSGLPRLSPLPCTMVPFLPSLWGDLREDKRLSSPFSSNKFQPPLNESSVQMGIIALHKAPPPNQAGYWPIKKWNINQGQQSNN